MPYLRVFGSLAYNRHVAEPFKQPKAEPHRTFVGFKTKDADGKVSWHLMEFTPEILSSLFPNASYPATPERIAYLVRGKFKRHYRAYVEQTSKA